MESKYKLTAHHLGCLTDSIEASKKIYSSTFGFNKFSEVFTVHEQKVKVCFIEIKQDFYIELVEPIGVNPAFARILKSGNPYYHIAYISSNIDEDLAKMLNDNCYLVNTFHSEAFGGKKCAFLYTPEMQLIELIQK